MTILSLIGGVFALGAACLAVGIYNAPEGYEDETGFHVLWRNNSPEVADVACIWTMATA
ncbi:MAG: hypothetical protein WCF18_18490 [Chthoniobacteraceae bacterium]